MRLHICIYEGFYYIEGACKGVYIYITPYDVLYCIVLHGAK